MQIVHSYWCPEVPVQQMPTLESDLKCDVVVIGAGVNGLSAAYELGRAGASVVLLERGTVGGHSSSKNFGVLTSDWAYHGAGLDRRRALARYGQGALEKVREMIEREGIDCDLKPNNHWLMARSKGGRKLVKAHTNELIQLGYDAGFVEPGQVTVSRSENFGAAYLRQYTLDPYRFMEGFKRAVTSANVRIFEGSGAISIEEGSEVRVRTSKGSVTAKHVVVASNGFNESFGLDTSAVAIPVHIFALATKPLSAKKLASIGEPLDVAATDMGTRAEANQRHWQRLRPDGTLLFGGGGVTVPSGNLFEPVPTLEKQKSLVAELRRRYPAIDADEIQFFWGGTITAPAGEKPTVARMRNSGIILAQACYGHGMGLGANIGELVKEVIAPGTLSDPNALAYLDYCRIRSSLSSKLEGAVMHLISRKPLRRALKLVVGDRSR